MGYCTSQSFVAKYPNDAILLVVISLYLLLSFYLIWKMCMLCSKAFSYTNFHIHEAYKFYSIALMSTLLIILNRIIEFNIPINNPQDSYFQGWLILDEIIGIISIFAMNQSYLITAMTWLMVSLQCDFSSQNQSSHYDLVQPELKFKFHRRCILARRFLLYYFIPITLLLSIIGELNYTPGWCQASKIITTFVCSITFITFQFSFMKILLERYKSDRTPLKVKLMWIYLLIMMAARQSYVIYQSLYQLKNAQGGQNINQIHTARLPEILFLYFYVIFLTIIPIVMVAYLADKQLVREQQSIQRQSQMFEYTSAVI